MNKGKKEERIKGRYFWSENNGKIFDIGVLRVLGGCTKRVLECYVDVRRAERK